MDNAVLRQGIENLAIATDAKDAAAAGAKDTSIEQQKFLSLQAVANTVPMYEKLKPLVPEAKAALIKVRNALAVAGAHAKHAREVLAYSSHIPIEAAQKAVEATKGWIKSEAAKSAEASALIDNRQDRLAGIVAAAAEPYHLALLRNQKFCEETYSKAKSAHTSAVQLLDDAKKVALQAQAMQTAGMGVDAQQTWGMASGMSNEANALRVWANKLYAQASTACGTAPGYQMLEQQAAANAAATTIMNAPAKLPAVGY